MAYTEYFLSFFLYENKLFQFTFTTNKWGKLHILIYIQQDATLHSLFYLETALHVSVGTTTHNQERKQLYLQHLVFDLSVLRVAYATHNTLKSVPSLPR